VTVLTMLALYLGRIRHLSSLPGAQMIRDLRAMPDAIRLALSCEESVKRIADRYFKSITSSTWAGSISIRSRWKGRSN